MAKKKGNKRQWRKIDQHVGQHSSLSSLLELQSEQPCACSSKQSPCLPQDVEDFLEKSTREERQGLAFEGVPDADLFFVDKARRGLAGRVGIAVGGAACSVRLALQFVLAAHAGFYCLFLLLFLAGRARGTTRT